MNAFAAGETITVYRVTENQYGDKTLGVSHDVDGCAIWPTTGKETITGGEDTVVFGLTILAPTDCDVLSSDRILVRGITYDVNGEPALHRSPLTGKSSGIEIQLTAATG